ncbi:hypothetical protein KO500_17045 [Cellulophaga baltica]|jgi:hypothetical protein|uniref:hypothetical protein n=1 Tax=Cellulophaga TaxID=104264 RepID=UPI001C06FAD9|nr:MULTISPECIES: hypothetical protein [Cellulophaga]MBU2998149.1 hypothetical protein [Cellulophaga baltica]MDO6769554.1 hypothetical protein [Cellulophaga sp. 1_MG-2023]
MKIFLYPAILLTLISCKQNKIEQKATESVQNGGITKVNQTYKNTKTSIETIEVSTREKPYKIIFSEKLVSRYTVESRNEVKSKALVRKLSEYTTKELEELPDFIRLNLAIVVPYNINKEGLINTMKSIVNQESKLNSDIDEIVIFAYDDKKDLNNGGGFYTFGKLFWGPNGKSGNVTPTIAKENFRNVYQFEIDIKEKVGNIKKTDLPSKWELDIYNTIMAEENIGMEEDKLNKMTMEKFNIKTTKELDAIWLKVAAYKN